MHRPPRRGRAVPRTAVATAAALLAILLVGAAVRLVGIDSGRPFAYHQDEWLVFKPAMRMVHERDWNPHSFLYPSLLIDMQAAVTAVLRWFGGPTLDTGQAWVFGTELLPEQFRYLLGGRLLVLGFGLTTIVVAFEIGRRLRGLPAGLVTAAVLASMPLHISDSRHLTTDVPVAMFCALTLLLTIKADADRRERWWLMAGIAAGLAASTKWNGALVLGVPLLAYLLPARDLAGIRGRLRSPTPYLICVTAVLAAIAATPAILLDGSSVIQALQLQANVYGVTRTGIPSDSLFLNLSGVVAGSGAIAAVLAGFGCVRFLLRPRRRVEVTIPAFIAATIAIASIPARQYDRNLIPILPFLAVAAACFVVDVPGIARAASRRPRGSGLDRVGRRVVVAMTVLILTSGLVLGVRAGLESGGRAKDVDTRTVARDWLRANVARNTVVARERETPMLMPDEYRLRPRFYLPERSLDWYRDAGAQVLVSSSFASGRFLGNPTTPDQDAWYRALFDLPEIFRVDPGPGRPGPTIRIFQLAPFEYRDSAPNL